MKNLLFTALFITLAAVSIAQPPESYYGGPGDGFHFMAYLSDSSIYNSGPSDGFAFGDFLPGNTIFEGGNSDGFANNIYINPSSIYISPSSDGFSAISYNNTNLLARGGDGDGFNVGNFLYYHDWTGIIGTGWLVAGNWKNNIVPNDSIRARIPAGVPNFPFINAGIFAIGSSTGNFLCRDLLIEPDAQLTTRINAITEIYSKVEIKGLMTVKNQTPNTFTTIGGTVVVYPGGELQITND